MPPADQLFVEDAGTVVSAKRHCARLGMWGSGSRPVDVRFFLILVL